MTITHTTTTADELDAWLTDAIASVAEQLDHIKALPEFIAWAEREAHDEIQTERGWIPRVTTDHLAITWLNDNLSGFTRPPLPSWVEDATLYVAGPEELSLAVNGRAFEGAGVNVSLDQFVTLVGGEERAASIDTAIAALAQPQIFVAGVQEAYARPDSLLDIARVLQEAADGISADLTA